jgi:hypothetical protein
MKLGSGRVSAIAAGVLALSVLTGVTAAAPASAASYTYLCLQGQGSSGCLLGLGAGDFVSLSGVEPGVAITNWVYPNSNGAMGQIQQANTDLCLQDDAVGAMGVPNAVREAACNGDEAEQWANVYNAGTKSTEFVNLYVLYDETQGAEGLDCLAWSGEVALAFIGGCTSANNAVWVS